MRILAFDYGVKRIGVAVTDPLQIIATALETVATNDIWNFLEKYLQAEQVETFVVGKPLQMDGSASQVTSHIVGFVRKLKETYPHISVVEMDERFTSKIASATISQSHKKKKDRQSKGLIDTVSATILLQSYMESQKFS